MSHLIFQKGDSLFHILYQHQVAHNCTLSTNLSYPLKKRAQILFLATYVPRNPRHGKHLKIKLLNTSPFTLSENSRTYLEKYKRLNDKQQFSCMTLQAKAKISQMTTSCFSGLINEAWSIPASNNSELTWYPSLTPLPIAPPCKRRKMREQRHQPPAQRSALFPAQSLCLYTR